MSMIKLVMFKKCFSNFKLFGVNSSLRIARPACLDEPELGKHSFVKLRDVRLHYVANGPEGKPLMLFLHGFPECWYSWRYQIPEFSKNYRTVALDMRGYGESDLPEGLENYTLTKLAEDVNQFVEALGYEKCVLVAHDWGGIVAQTFLLQNPLKVEKLVLINIPHLKAFRDTIRSNIGQFLKSWYIYMFQLPCLPEMMLRRNNFQTIENILSVKVPGAEKVACDSRDVQAYKYYLSRPGGLTGPINYYRALIQTSGPDIPDWTIHVPTLMVWGEQDNALSKVLPENSRKYMPNLSVHYIQEAGHWVLMDSPMKVNQYMREFLDG